MAAETAKADFGVIGLGVMGQNLALNFADHHNRVAVWNRDVKVQERVVKEHPQQALIGKATLQEFVGALARPRRILVMVKAGDAVDAVITSLKPLLQDGDIIIDGGNSWFEDTRRRETDLKSSGLRFFGMGVSGGEEGARNGPSLMPGGDQEAYAQMRAQLESISAKTDSGPCVAHCGADGAGHFVKMVHNGIEYADMQLIAEAYDVLRHDVGLDAAALREVFTSWNEGPLSSFLIEITAKIFGVIDPETGKPLVDIVLDQAGQKGTGKWTVRIALELGVAIPGIAAALDARVVSANKAQRVQFSTRLAGPASKPATDLSRDARIKQVHDALLAAKICAYAQGMELIKAASSTYGWNIDRREMARIWKGGCIIRAKLLDQIMRAYEKDAALPNLLLDDVLGGQVKTAQSAWRGVTSRAQLTGIAVPAISASLAWYDMIRSAEMPLNLTQAQRDAFGSHTYQRRDKKDAPFVHSEWLK